VLLLQIGMVMDAVAGMTAAPAMANARAVSRFSPRPAQPQAAHAAFPPVPAELLTPRVRSLLRTRSPPLRMVAESLSRPSPGKATRPKRGRLNVRIDDAWYDLTNWRAAHPAGTHWIDAYNNSDATEVMYGFHSDAAMSMITRLPVSKSPPTDVPPPTKTTYAFRELRNQLEAEGWYKTQPFGEALKLAPWALFSVAGLWLSRYSRGIAVLGSVFCIAVSNTLAGWLAHDYVHGRGRFSTFMRPFGELFGGMSTTWWSNKHNMHHALTNEVGYDEDIALEPFIYLWSPDPARDSKLRKIQHLYWPLPFSSLFYYWRLDSLRFAQKHRKWGELSRLVAHWAFYLTVFPAKQLLLGIWLSGFMTSTIVTATHQSEEIFLKETSRKHDFAEAQFRSTRNARIPGWGPFAHGPFSSMLWGGMQWQLEHHLFPTVPRYRYPELSKRLKAFADSNGLDYRVTDEWDLIKLNIETLKELSTLQPIEGNPDSTPVFKQV